MIFEDLNLVRPILKALKDEGYENPTPIQQKVIPYALKGEDILGCSQTGTGKTAAFAIPILQNIFIDKNNNRGVKDPRYISALILAPTRELAIQIGKCFESYACYMNIRTVVIYGGTSMYKQIEEVSRGMDILVSTPGRILEFIKKNYINLDYIKYFVLDEADRMLYMGMLENVKEIILSIPEEAQSMMFSATIPEQVKLLINSILKNPIKINVSHTSPICKNITHGVYFVDKINKMKLLLHILNNKNIESALIFSKTKHDANKIKYELLRYGISADTIHGDRSQRERERVLNKFKARDINFLVATDIVARGIDLDSLPCVINFHFPSIPEAYIHRIGRTGRGINKGAAYSFCDIDERDMLYNVEKIIDEKIEIMIDNPYPAMNVIPKDNFCSNGFEKYKRGRSIKNSTRLARNSRRKK